MIDFSPLTHTVSVASKAITNSIGKDNKMSEKVYCRDCKYSEVICLSLFDLKGSRTCNKGRVFVIMPQPIKGCPDYKPNLWARIKEIFK